MRRKVKIRRGSISNSGVGQESYSAFIATLDNEIEFTYAKKFYKTFPYDSQISIREVETISPSTYLNLLKRINASRNRNILIFTHANSVNGIFSFEYSMGNRVEIDSWEGFFKILHYSAVQRIYSRVKRSKNPEDWTDILNLVTKYYDTSTAKSTLVALKDLGLYESKYDKNSSFSEIIEVIGKYKKKELRPEELQEKIAKWKEKVRRYKRNTVERLQITQGIMNQYISELSEIQTRRLNNLAIRGCLLGNNEIILEIYSIFFNVQKINAPTIFLNLGIYNIQLNKQNRLRKIAERKYETMFGKTMPQDKGFGAGTWTESESGSYAMYYNPKRNDKSKDELFIYITVTDTEGNYGGKVIAESMEIVRIFTLQAFGKKIPYISTSMPVYFLEEDPPLFPQDKGFEKCYTSKTFGYEDFFKYYR